MEKVELLAPAGDMECLKAAVLAGCDAIYVGGQLYSARSSAKNFSLEELEEAVDYCHLRGVKLYLTVNTIYKDNEISELFEFLKKAYEMGIDAFIVQDIGIATIIKKHFKEIELHASTQMTIHNLNGAKYLKDLGFDRIVLSRELSSSEIKNIADNSGVELETFIHGALCMSYSGQCLMSSFIGKRSGNRGECAQPCRLPYVLKDSKENVVFYNENILSLKDLNTLKILDKVIESGTKSLKIEGRMKSKEYVYGVVSIYRKYIDLYYSNKYAVDEKDNFELKQLFNRGNMTEGYYEKSKDMIYRKSPKHMGIEVGEVVEYKNNNALIRLREDLKKGDGIYIINDENETFGLELFKDFSQGEFRIEIDGVIKKGDKVFRSKSADLNNKISNNLKTSKVQRTIYMELEATDKVKLSVFDEEGNFASYETDNNETTTPITDERILEQLSKTGDTVFKVQNINLNFKSECNIRIATLNFVRREALILLEATVLNAYKRTCDETLESVEGKKQTKKEISVLINDFNKLNEILENEYIDIVYVENYNIDNEINLIKEKGKKVFIALPNINRDNVDNYSIIDKYIDLVDGFLVRDYGQLYYLKDKKTDIVIDYTFNIYNSYSANFFKDYKIVPSVEMNEYEIKGLKHNNMEVIVYGKFPLMTMSQCISDSCDGKNYTMIDRKDEEYILEKDCKRCLNKIYSKENFDIRNLSLNFSKRINYIYDEEKIENIINSIR